MRISKLSSIYSVRRLLPNDIDEIFELCGKNKLFYEYHPPFVSKESIAEDMSALPAGKDYCDKYYIGFYDHGRLISVMDLILGFPQGDTAFIGFFMMDTASQGKNIGSQIIHECLTYLSDLGYRSVQLGVDKGNPQSNAFWKKNKFTQTGKVTKFDASMILTLERILK